LRYKRARASLNKREELTNEAIESLEENMEYLGVTGVEDKLQEDVLTTIETLRSAGIQVWMLTGDKIETAKCIAISAGLKARR
jgi:phospholipid-translocating ATPase